MLREVKPKNARSARALAARGPLLHENAKTTLFLKGSTSSDLLNKLSTNLYSLKKPFAQRFSKKNAIHPFEDASSLEFFAVKNDASLLLFGSHAKKRPHCMTLVRTFDGRVLDMMELMVDAGSARVLEQFPSKNRVPVGTKPLISFSGAGFADEDPGSRFGVARSLLLDFFRGEEASDVHAEGLQMMITFTAVEEESVVDGVADKQMIHMRVWKVITRKSGQKVPRVELAEMGPRIDWRLGRLQAGDSSMMKEALKRGKSSTEAKTKKNVDTDVMGDKMGRIHLGKQDFADLQTRKMKGLKRGRDEERNGDGDELPDVDEGEISGSDNDDDDGDDDNDGVDIEEMLDLVDGDDAGSGAEDADAAAGVNDAESRKRQKLG